MKAFSVRRMVAKNFSWCSNTRVTTWADLFPCSARYLILSLLTEIRLASALLKNATKVIQTTITVICRYRPEMPRLPLAPPAANTKTPDVPRPNGSSSIC